MYKTLSATAIAAALLFAVPHAASALPGQGTSVKTENLVNEAGYKHRRGYHKHRHWKHRHHYRKRRGIHLHVH
jgi:hypothetical protein